MIYINNIGHALEHIFAEDTLYRCSKYTYIELRTNRYQTVVYKLRLCTCTLHILLVVLH